MPHPATRAIYSTTRQRVIVLTFETADQADLWDAAGSPLDLEPDTDPPTFTPPDWTRSDLASEHYRQAHWHEVTPRTHAHTRHLPATDPLRRAHKVAAAYHRNAAMTASAQPTCSDLHLADISALAWAATDRAVTLQRDHLHTHPHTPPPTRPDPPYPGVPM